MSVACILVSSHAGVPKFAGFGMKSIKHTDLYRPPPSIFSFPHRTTVLAAGRPPTSINLQAITIQLPTPTAQKKTFPCHYLQPFFCLSVFGDSSRPTPCSRSIWRSNYTTDPAPHQLWRIQRQRSIWTRSSTGFWKVSWHATTTAGLLRRTVDHVSELLSTVWDGDFVACLNRACGHYGLVKTIVMVNI